MDTVMEQVRVNTCIVERMIRRRRNNPHVGELKRNNNELDNNGYNISFNTYSFIILQLFMFATYKYGVCLSDIVVRIEYFE